MPLTAKQVEKAGPGRHGDGKGLHLLVKPSGAKSWVLRAQVNGRRRDFGLGPADLVTLAEAREKALQGRRWLREGKDPAVEWKRSTLSVPTFEQMAREYHANVKAGWKNEDDAKQWLTSLEAHVFPVIGKRTVDAIEARDIRDALLPIWLKIPTTAKRVKQRIGAVLDFAHAQNWRSSEAPMRAAVKGLPAQPKAKKHLPAMPYNELPAFFGKARAMPPTVGRLAALFTILTAARPIETRKARWGDIDFEAKTWTVPAANLKREGGGDHLIPLSDEAIGILQELRGLLPGDPEAVVFPGVKGKPIAEYTMLLAFMNAGGSPYTVHGTARSSFRDWGAEKMPTVPGDVFEAALAHAVRSKTERAYLRTKYLEQRRPIMTAWAEFLQGKVNVVALAERRA